MASIQPARSSQTPVGQPRAPPNTSTQLYEDDERELEVLEEEVRALEKQLIDAQFDLEAAHRIRCAKEEELAALAERLMGLQKTLADALNRSQGLSSSSQTGRRQVEELVRSVEEGTKLAMEKEEQMMQMQRQIKKRNEEISNLRSENNLLLDVVRDLAQAEQMLINEINKNNSTGSGIGAVGQQGQPANPRTAMDETTDVNLLASQARFLATAAPPTSPAMAGGVVRPQWRDPSPKRREGSPRRQREASPVRGRAEVAAAPGGSMSFRPPSSTAVYGAYGGSMSFAQPNIAGNRAPSPGPPVRSPSPGAVPLSSPRFGAVHRARSNEPPAVPASRWMRMPGV